MNLPEVRIVRGNPSEDEAEAVRAAVIELWRADVASAAGTGGADPWVLAARIEGARQDAGVLRERAPSRAWRLSGWVSGPVSHLTAGRGDAK